MVSLILIFLMGCNSLLYLRNAQILPSLATVSTSDRLLFSFHMSISFFVHFLIGQES